MTKLQQSQDQHVCNQGNYPNKVSFLQAKFTKRALPRTESKSSNQEPIEQTDHMQRHINQQISAIPALESHHSLNLGLHPV
jgi:hypothetical protein